MGAALLPLSSPCHARVHPHSVPGLVAPSWTAASHPDHHPGGAEERASSRSSASSRAPSSSSPASTRLPALPTPQPQSCSFLEAAAAPRRPSGLAGPQVGRSQGPKWGSNRSRCRGPSMLVPAGLEVWRPQQARQRACRPHQRTQRGLDGFDGREGGR